MTSLTKLANKFRLILAQQASAQSGDIEGALKKANLWELSNEVAALVSVAKVPDSSSVAISIVASPGSKISFQSTIDDPGLHVEPSTPEEQKKLETVKASLANIGKSLDGLLARKYAAPMAKAIQAANLTVSDTVMVNWLKF